MNILLIGRGKMGAALSEAAKERGWQTTQVDKKDLARLKTLPPFDGAADFSHPQMTGAVCQFVRRTKTPLCCGTTGQSPAQLKELRSLGKTAPVLLCANFSTGIHLLHRWLSLVKTPFPIGKRRWWKAITPKRRMRPPAQQRTWHSAFLSTKARSFLCGAAMIPAPTASFCWDPGKKSA